MRKKLGFGLLLAIAVLLFIMCQPWWNPTSVAGVANLVADREYEAELFKQYELKFGLDKTPAGNMNEYVPKYRPADIDTVYLYGGLFGMDANFSEDDGSFILEDDKGCLYIDKYVNRIHYIVKETELKTDPIVSDQQAIELALDFFDSMLLYVSYEEASVGFDGQRYEVMFISRLGNLKNYAFNDRIIMDRHGNVKSLDYNYIVYEKLNTTPIKSMAESYYELPVDLGEDQTADLKSGQLVYIYENSIIQPAYLFEGELAGETPKSFQCFVKASVYE